MTKEQFKKFAKEEFGYDISFEKSDEPDTYESLFGSCKGCEHVPTTYEEYCLHTCCPDAYTDKAAGCELFKKQRAIEESYKKGLNDAWECARKIQMDKKDGGMSTDALKKAFGVRFFSPYNTFRNFTASEAIAKIKGYEEKQTKPTEEDINNFLQEAKNCGVEQTEKSCRTCGYTKTSMPNYNDDRCKKCHYDGDGNTLWMPKQTEKSCETCKRHNLPIGAFGIDRIAYEYLICYECLKGSQNHYEKQSRRKKA